MHYFPFYILNSAFVTQLAKFQNATFYIRLMSIVNHKFIRHSTFVIQLAVGKEQLAKKTNAFFPHSTFLIRHS